MRHAQGRITDFSRLFAEDGAQQAFLCGQLGFALRRYLTHQDIIRPHLCTDAYDAAVVQILQSIFAHVGDIPCNFLRPQLGVARVRLKFADMHRSIYIFLYQFFAQKDSVLVVVAFPRHEADERIFAQRKLALAG